jgi:hypothetical protein
MASGMLAAPAHTEAWLGSPSMRALLCAFISPCGRDHGGRAELGFVAHGGIGTDGAAPLWVHRAERSHEDASTMQSLAHLDGSPGGPAAGLRRGSARSCRWHGRGPPHSRWCGKRAAVARRRGLFGATLLWMALWRRVEAFVRLDAAAAAYVGACAATWVGFALFTGPQFIRNDLRHDLPHLASLRALPLRADTLWRRAGVVGEHPDGPHGGTHRRGVSGLRVSPELPAWLRQWRRSWHPAGPAGFSSS